MTSLIEFNDGAPASGRLLEAGPDAAVLRMLVHRTRSGTDVAARTWRLAPTSEPGALRVQRPLPAA